MAIPLRLDTDDLQIAFDLLSGDTALQPGTQIVTPGGAMLRYRRRVPRRRPEAGGRLEFELTATTRANAEPLAEWLYERLRNRIPRVHLGPTAVPVDREALRQALLQEI